ncbi:MAG TPA: ATP-binding protein [Polyangia bacterium]|nr:ATP-binding protein [Polyangia bacterium]
MTEATASSSDRPAVLVVDDIEANVIAMEALLSTLDCEVVRARTGNEALRWLLKRDFAVMLLDVQMPEMDGFEVARYARDNPSTRDVPIVFVTAMHETPDNLLRGYGSGAVDVLFKPVNPHVVRSKVQIFLDLHLGRRRLRDEIEAHKATLAELEAFNYSVSHDLRAPLRPLDGFSASLLEDYGDKLDEKGVRHLTRIREAALRMGQLIEDLLALSRVSRQDLRRQPVDLPAIVESIVAELRAAEPTREVALVCGPVPAAQGDPRLLRIALENLLRNAWKFTQKSPTARIEFGALPGPEPVYFVRDDGVGFDPTFSDKLFEPFQRLHRAADFEGTGIGLAIVNRIVRRHGGRVWAESSVGNGATFYFTVGAPPVNAR